MSALGIPFDERQGIIPNDLYGRIIAPSKEPETHRPWHVPGMYCAGWVKRGPTGVIASTMNDAFATAEAIARDWEERAPFLSGTDDGAAGGIGDTERQRKQGWEALKKEAESRGSRRVSWGDWLKIDAAERERGRRRGKEREKFGSVKEMLSVLD